MKLVKYGVLGVLAFVALVLGVALFLPSKWHVEQRVAMKASAAAIHPYVETLREWENWTTWKADDPHATYRYTGAERGVGATMSWVGRKVGTGTLSIRESDLGGIAYEMSMEGGTPAAGTISFVEENGVTTVTWVDDGDFGHLLPARYFVGTMERTLGDNFGRALGNLKRIAERKQLELDAKAAAERAANEKALREGAAAVVEGASPAQAPDEGGTAVAD